LAQDCFSSSHHASQEVRLFNRSLSSMMIALLFFPLCFTCNALRLPSPSLESSMKADSGAPLSRESSIEANDEVIMATTQSINNHLRKRMTQFPDDKQPLVLMFANHAYREVVINQMVGFHTLNITNTVVVCLDQQLADFMASTGKPCIRDLIGSGGISDIWKARLQVMDNLLKNGTSVLLTDADAVWVKSPMEFLKDVDMVMQRASFPGYVKKKLGATACMGFAYFAGNPAVSNFFHEEVLNKFKNDDQLALNVALRDNGIYFDHKLEFEKSREIDSGIIPAKTDRPELHVKFLDHYRFPRICHADTIHADTVVAHCWSHKDGNSKISEVKKRGLYWLKNDWEQAPRNEDFEAFITSITSERVIQKQANENSRVMRNADQNN